MNPDLRKFLDTAMELCHGDHEKEALVLGIINDYYDELESYNPVAWAKVTRLLGRVADLGQFQMPSNRTPN